MNHFITRIASFVLAFGFFISCSTLSTSNNDSDPSDDLSAAQLQQRIDSVDKQIAEGPNNPGLFYQKGFYLTELAQKRNPAERTTFYSDAHAALMKAADLYSNSTNTSEKEKAQELLKVTWSNEHNQGVQIMQDDTVTESPNYLRAATHFNNATVIIPDSSISYKMEARAHYKNQNKEKAIEVLELARKNIAQPPLPMLEQLAFLYLETDQPQQAVGVYEQANSFSDQNLNLLHGLSNAYISAGQHQEAIELLQVLIENEPENIIYGQSLATELYQAATDEIESIISDLQNGDVVDEESLNSADSLFQRAENEFERISNEYPDDVDLKRSFAQFYQNSAAKYQKLLPHVEQQNEQQISSKIVQYLSSSIPLFEQLAEQQPNEQGIWQNLYQAYTYLGMTEKAEEAKTNL